MNIAFSVEQLAIMGLYHTESKSALLDDLREALPYVDDPEALTSMAACIELLPYVSEDDFRQIDFTSELL